MLDMDPPRLATNRNDLSHTKHVFSPRADWASTSAQDRTRWIRPSCHGAGRSRKKQRSEPLHERACGLSLAVTPSREADRVAVLFLSVPGGQLLGPAQGEVRLCRRLS
jgi:hypothetical protein